MGNLRKNLWLWNQMMIRLCFHMMKSMIDNLKQLMPELTSKSIITFCIFDLLDKIRPQFQEGITLRVKMFLRSNSTPAPDNQVIDEVQAQTSSSQKLILDKLAAFEKRQVEQCSISTWIKSSQKTLFCERKNQNDSDESERRTNCFYFLEKWTETNQLFDASYQDEGMNVRLVFAHDVLKNVKYQDLRKQKC